MTKPRGVLLDLDGTVYEDDAPFTGAAAAIATLRKGGVPIRFVTNMTRAPRETIAGWLKGFGIPAVADDIFTLPRAAVAWLAERVRRRVALCLPPACRREFWALEVVDEAPQTAITSLASRGCGAPGRSARPILQRPFGGRGEPGLGDQRETRAGRGR